VPGLLFLISNGPMEEREREKKKKKKEKKKSLITAGNCGISILFLYC
jgi:hypothetical protein